MVQFDYMSRYRQTEQIVVDGKETVGYWNQPSYLSERPANAYINRLYISSALAGRPDLIANALYGSPQLDWVLIAFNNPTEPLNWPSPGTTIEYPSYDLVRSEL